MATQKADPQIVSLHEEQPIDMVVSSDGDFVLHGVPLAAFWDYGDSICYYPRILICDEQNQNTLMSPIEYFANKVFNCDCEYVI